MIIFCYFIGNCEICSGEVAEWSMATHSKCVKRVKLLREFESRPLRSKRKGWLGQPFSFLASRARLTFKPPALRPTPAG